MSFFGFGLADGLAALWFIICWIGFFAYADRPHKGRRNLMAVMADHRLEWMRQMIRRDMRMADVLLIGNLMRSVTFLASTTILIIGGLLTVFGLGEEALAVLGELPLTVQTTSLMWEIKLLTLVVIFVFAFFKFTWSLRQFNYSSVLLGAAPLAGDAAAEPFAVRLASLVSLAANHFNGGLRAYYFGIAMLPWFLHPWLFMAATTWVVLILYRREYHSSTCSIIGASSPS